MTATREKNYSISSAITAFLLVAGILTVSTFAARAVQESKLYRQSRFATYIFSQDSTGLGDIVKAPEKVDVFVKFLGAVTAAYINFEMIPVNEVQTFVTVFESLNDSVEIESFSYRGKTLTISGFASDRKEYFQFYNSLEEKDYFMSVSGHQFVDTDDNIRFELECILEYGE